MRYPSRITTTMPWGSTGGAASNFYGLPPSLATPIIHRLRLEEARMRSITSLALLMFAIAGCNNGMDQQSATKVMSSALIGTGTAQAQFKPTNGQTNASFDGTIQNPAGSGSAHVTGSAVDNNGTWTVTFDITYAQWT